MLIRKPHVAGSFYPSDPAELRQFFDAYFQPSAKLLQARAIILPHAGYIYSGQTACRVVSHIQVPDKVFMMGPNHHGYGEEFSICTEGEWETPLGKVRIDSSLAQAMVKRSPHVRNDPQAHTFEHSLEVLLPFLQKKNPALQIVPMMVGTMNLARAKTVAMECAEVLSQCGEPVLIAVSTDMSHYEPDDVTRKKDQYALRAIENLDEEALAQAVKDHRITMCGFVPVYMLLVMHKQLRFRKAALIDYRTSADATGERDRVVGYAGFVIE